MKIFISYATEDLERFRILSLALTLENCPKIEKVFFWDRDSDASQSIIKYMEESIKNSDCIIAISSQNSKYSGPVDQEIEMAVYLGKTIIPVFQDIKDVRLSLQTKRGVRYNSNHFDLFIKELYRVVTGDDLLSIPQITLISDSKPTFSLDDKQKKFEYFKEIAGNFLKLNQFKDALINFQEAVQLSKDLMDTNLTLEISNQIQSVKELIKNDQQLNEETLWNDIIRILDFLDEPTQKEIYEEAIKILSRSERARWLKLKFDEYSFKMGNYAGIQLLLKERKFLHDIEKILGEPIPNVSSMNAYTFGFTIDNAHITKLGLFQKKLTSLPRSIGNLHALQYLNLAHNFLTNLPDSIGSLSSLYELTLIYNNLKDLPETIGNLKALQTLHLMNNKLTNLPDTICNLQSLQKLNLGNNYLEYLPESISNLESLQILWLQNNYLTQLPDSIATLPSLQILNLDQNKLTNLPPSLLNSQLSAISVNNNPLTQDGKKFAKQLQKKDVSPKITSSLLPLLCPVCKSHILPNDITFNCPKCGSLTHKDHFFQYFRLHHMCPLCKKKLRLNLS